MELKKYKLGELADFYGGVAYKPSDITNEGIRIIRGGNIQNGVILEKADDVFLPLSYANPENQIHIYDTIIVSSTGSIDALAKAATCFEEMPGTQIGAFLRIIRPKDKKNAMLISAWCTSQHFRDYMINCAKGTSINNIRTDFLENYELVVPSDENVRGLSSLYFNIERKLYLNRQINTNLEALARQLYDYWFVQFDFPDANGKPYKSSGGKMTYNEKLKREIPDGWEVKSITQISSLRRGVSYAKDDLLNEGGILVLRGNNIENNKLVYDANVAFIPDNFVSSDQHLYKGDIVMTMSSGSKEHIGKCIYFYQDSEHTFGAFLSKITPVRKYAQMVFLFFCSNFYKVKIKSICSGTGINNLTNQTFDNIYLVIPDEHTLERFNVIIEPIFDATGNNESEISSLTKKRDELLPLLMNGQVTVE